MGHVSQACLTGVRSPAGQVDAANPRAADTAGHIIEIGPEGGDHGGAAFRWEILVRCGDGGTFAAGTSADGWFANPDDCAIDGRGRLWIATDGNSRAFTGRADGIWAIETEGPRATSRACRPAPRCAAPASRPTTRPSSSPSSIPASPTTSTDWSAATRP